MKFKKITNVRLPFDRRDPDPKKNYGIYGLQIGFVLVGPKGAVEFIAYVPTYLPHVERERKDRVENDREISGRAVGYHSLQPMFEGQHQMDCTHLEGGKCYYDSSSLQAEEWGKEIFSARGVAPEELIWEKLENYYRSTFEASEVRIRGTNYENLDRLKEPK